MEHSGRHQRGNGRLHNPVAAFQRRGRYSDPRLSALSRGPSEVILHRWQTPPVSYGFLATGTSRFFSISTKGEGFSLLNSAHTRWRARVSATYINRRSSASGKSSTGGSS